MKIKCTSYRVDASLLADLIMNFAVSSISNSIKDLPCFIVLMTHRSFNNSKSHFKKS